jgi:hypothetical protein
MVAAGTDAPLKTFCANRRAGFVRPVGQEEGHRGTAVRISREGGGIHISLADIIQVIGIGKAVYHFKTQVHAVVERILEAYSERNGKGHGAIRLALGIGRIALPFGAERT